MPWSQNYAPLGGIGISALVAALPVIVLFGLLAFWQVRAQLAALAAVLVAAFIAVAAYHMPPQLTLAAGVYGASFGIFPIGWIVANAIFIYAISVETGQFVVLQNQVAGISRDRRIQTLLIAFNFGAFIESAAGFGAPVAITGALMIGLGFPPREAAKLALIGNTAPVAFGALGTPIITLASITGLDLHALSSVVGRQLSVVSLIIPFWLVATQAGWRGMVAVWPACLVTGASFSVTQFLVSNYHGPWLVGVISAFVSMSALVVLMKFWKPVDEFAQAEKLSVPRAEQPIAIRGSPWKAWLPWIFLTVLVFVWGLPWVKAGLNNILDVKIPVPLLHHGVQRMPPVTAQPQLENAIFDFNLLSATGTALFVAGILSGLCLRISPRNLLLLYLRTVWRVRVSLLTIALMLMLGFITRYCGSDTTMGVALAATGIFFPFFSPLIGWLGVAMTGSDTSSNVLFGNLQQVSARQLNLSPVLMAAANSSGGVMGKMIDAQSIVVASTVTGGQPDSPKAGEVLRDVFWHSLALAGLMGILVMLMAYL